MSRGFSTLELMIAFAILCVVFAGVAAAQYGTQYWALMLETSGEALSKAQAEIDSLRMAAEIDFLAASSTAFAASNACGSGEFCYYRENSVEDISSCAKRVETVVSWRSARFATSTVLLSDFLVDFSGLLATGGDCGTAFSADSWASLEENQSFPLQGTPAGIDALLGTVYVIEQNPSRLAIIADGEMSVYTPSSNEAFNAIDVAHNFADEKIYAYIAATSSQLRIIDVTDPSAPEEIASTTLATVPSGYQAGWRLQYYDGSVYIVTRQMNKPAAREFHVIDVADPENPIETGSYKLNTSPYAILVRDQKIDVSTSRFAYLATTHASRELMVLDVTDPQNISIVATCDLPSSQQGTSLFMIGNMLYLGRENVPSGGEDLYTFDASDPTGDDFCASFAKADINDDSFSRHVQAIRGIGKHLFVATNNTTNAHGKIQVRDANDLVKTAAFTLDALVENGIDFDADTGIVFAITGGANPALHFLRGE
ncbi:hypothetical protein C4568_02220 [Candidatus Parcubacteria bacterium]|nr:MAG: hypothetical protein C4568_02220 [Candidatus Parcubacteria bacterium]